MKKDGACAAPSVHRNNHPFSFSGRESFCLYRHVQRACVNAHDTESLTGWCIINRVNCRPRGGRDHLHLHPGRPRSASSRSLALRHWPRCDGSAWLAQEAEERCCTWNRLIKMPDRISEGPPRGVIRGCTLGSKIVPEQELTEKIIQRGAVRSAPAVCVKPAASDASARCSYVRAISTSAPAIRPSS